MKLVVICVAVVFSVGLSSAERESKDDSNCIYETPDDSEPQVVLCVTSAKTVRVGDNTSLEIYFESYDSNITSFQLNISEPSRHRLSMDPYYIVNLTNGSRTTLILEGVKAGKSYVEFYCLNTSNETTDDDNISTDCPFSQEEYLDYVRRDVSFARNLPLNIIIAVVGWIYFAAWSISFYPQIILNFRRRSVVGLNFDFLSFNITGFLAYSLFNCGLYWIPEIQDEYFRKNPGGVNPVQLNDVIFSLHAFAATAFTIFQCLIFERNKQRVSYTGLILLIIFWLVMIISLFVSVGGKLPWLEFLYIASYVKLAITLVKYVPQAWFNCRRRSTVGWSIGNIILDFTGGSFSIFQMFLLSYNYDDWNSIFGDPTKFGLGFFSICFDLLFMCQHYVLFRHPPQESGGYTEIKEDPEKEPLLSDGDSSHGEKRKFASEEQGEEVECPEETTTSGFKKFLRLCRLA